MASNIAGPPCVRERRRYLPDAASVMTAAFGCAARPRAAYGHMSQRQHFEFRRRSSVAIEASFGGMLVNSEIARAN
jgi:hypothetical protein